MTHLRKIMLEELERRNYAQTIIDSYIHAVEHFAQYFRRSPDQLVRITFASILRLPDLEQSKNAVLHSLAAPSSQESYSHAIDEFIGWYCSEPRWAFS